MSVSQASRLLITARALYDGTGSVPLPDAAVLVVDGLVAFAGARSRIPGDLDLEARIDLPDGAVVPGLIDAHVHTTSPDAMQAYLSHGVTTIRYAGIATEVVDGMRLAIAERALPGPRILDSGPMIDGGLPAWPEWSEVATTPPKARELAARLAASGRYDALYAVQKLAPELVRAIVDVAHDYRIPVTGQLWATDAMQAASVGVDQLDNNSRIFVSRQWPAERLLAYESMPERLSNMAHGWLSVDWDATSRAIDMMVAAKVTYCPTFVVWEDTSDDSSSDRDRLAAEALAIDEKAQQAWDQSRRRIRHGWTAADLAAWRSALEPRLEWASRFRERGGRLVVGTDMEFGALYLQRELVFLRQAGFSATEGIAAATGESAKALGIGGAIGTIEPGKVADLVLLNADPTTDLTALTDIEAVIVGGRVYSESKSPTLGKPST